MSASWRSGATEEALRSGGRGGYIYRSKGSYFKAFGPKDHIIKGFWAILSLRVRLLTGLGYYSVWVFGV